MWLRDGIIRCWVFVPCNSENISCRTFLKHKNSSKQELALWHLVNSIKNPHKQMVRLSTQHHHRKWHKLRKGRDGRILQGKRNLTRPRRSCPPISKWSAERANQSVLHGLKPRLQVALERTPGCWAEEVPAVLWGLRTSVNRSIG